MNDNNASYLERTNNATSFSGSDIDIFNIIVLAKGLELYASTGLKPTAYYTPTNMLKMATKFTKVKYKKSRAGYLHAAFDLMALSDHLKNSPRQEKGIWERDYDALKLFSRNIIVS